MTPKELQILKDAAARHQSSLTPDQRLSDEMAEHFGGMAWATAKRLAEEFARDGWSVVSVSYKTDGHASIELYRSDLLAAALEGRQQ